MPCCLIGTRVYVHVGFFMRVLLSLAVGSCYIQSADLSRHLVFNNSHIRYLQLVQVPVVCLNALRFGSAVAVLV